MSLCTHNEQIQLFCMFPECQSATPGGCLKCFASEHLHNQNPKQSIQLQQVNKLMNIYSFSNKIKPECVSIQESFYNYFKKIREEFKQIINVIDEMCRNVINSVGFPYICYKNNFTVFKRIKNKEFNRIRTAEFQKFINQTENSSISKITQLQQKLYFKQVNNSHEMIKQIQHLLGSFENITKYYEQKTKFTHNNSEYLLNKQLIEKIKLQYKNSSGTNGIAKKKNQTFTQDSRKMNQKAQRVVTEEAEPVGGALMNSAILKKSYKQQGEPAALDISKSQGQKLSISGLKIDGNRSKLMGMLKNEQKQKQINSLRKGILNQNHNDKDRRVSLDAQIIKRKQNKLQQKAEKLKQLKGDQKFQIEGTNAESQQISQKHLKNINIPVEEQKIKKQVGEVQLVPVTRKLSEKLYESELTQISSPLLKNKFKANSRKSSGSRLDQNKKTAETSIKKEGQKQTHVPITEIPKPSLPQLTPAQQNSFMMLTESLKLSTLKAIPILQKSLQECNRNLSAAEYLSYLYLESNQFKKCITLCDDYILIIGKNKDLIQSRNLLLNNKCLALNNLGRYSETIKILQNEGLLSENIIKNLANAYYGLGFLDQAIKLYNKVLQQCNDDQIYYNLSGCLYLVKKYDEAKKAIESALAFQPLKKQYLQLEKVIKGLIKNLPPAH